MKTKLLTLAFLLLVLAGCSKKGEPVTINTSYGAWEVKDQGGYQQAIVYLLFDQDFELEKDGEIIIANPPFARINLILFSNGKLNGSYRIIRDEPTNPGEADLYISGYKEDLGWMKSGTIEISDGKIVCQAKADSGRNVVVNFKGELKFAEYGIDEVPE